MWSAVREFKVVNPWARSARLQNGTEGERQQAGRLYTKLSMYRVEQRGVGQSVSLHSMAIYGQTDFFFSSFPSSPLPSSPRRELIVIKALGRAVTKKKT